jgi:hypothetical protein
MASLVQPLLTYAQQGGSELMADKFKENKDAQSGEPVQLDNEQQGGQQPRPAQQPGQQQPGQQGGEQQGAPQQGGQQQGQQHGGGQKR